MAKKYYWLKLKNDFFRCKEIKKLRKIAGGDTYVVIYLKMQLLSLENGGVLYFDGVEKNFVDEIALELDEDPENVSVTINFLQRQGLIESQNEDEYLMTEVPELTGSESESAARMRKLRARENTASQCDMIVQSGDESVISCDTEKEIDIEKDIEIEKEKEKEAETAGEPKRKNLDYVAIKNLYNSLCIDLPQISKITDKRKISIRNLLTMFRQIDVLKDLDQYEQLKVLFDAVHDSDFLCGRTEKPNKWCGFDWIANYNNAIKILEGNYKNNGGNVNGGKSEYSGNTVSAGSGFEEVRSGNEIYAELLRSGEIDEANSIDGPFG